MLRSRDWEGIFRAAVIPSMEAAGKTLRYAVPAARKPGVAILATRATHASRPVFHAPENALPIPAPRDMSQPS